MRVYFYNFLNVGLIFIVSALSVSAQEISAYILDANSKAPVAGATILCKESFAVSDESGYFFLSACEGDSLLIRHIAYKTDRIAKSIIVRKDTLYLQSNSQVIDPITVTGTRYGQSSSESVVSLEVIGQSRIERENTPNIEEMVTKISGVQISDGQASIRGGSGYSYGAGSRVMLLVDDMPGLQQDAMLTNWRDIPTENVEQIEVIKGASSILYGSSALNGVINVRTGYAGSEPETKVSVQSIVTDAPAIDSMKWWDGALITTNASILHKQKFGKLDLVSSLFYFNDESYFKGSYREYGRGHLKLRYRLRPELSFGINANLNAGSNNAPFYWEDYGAETLIADTASYSESDYTRYFIDPFLKYYASNGDEHIFRGRFFRTNNRVDMDRANESNTFLAEYQYVKTLEEIDMIITTGILGSRLNSSAELYSNEEFIQWNGAAYAQVDYEMTEQLKIIAGLRYEINKTVTPDSVPFFEVNEELNEYDRLVGRLGLNYQVSDYSKFRASWGQGYRYPSIAERFISTNIGINVVPNPELRPETGWTAEIGWRQGLQLGKWKGFLDLSFYRMEYTDMMEFNVRTFMAEPFLGFQSRNIGDTEIQGFEIITNAQLKLDDKNLIEVYAGYNYVDPRYSNLTDDIKRLNTSDKNILKYRQRHQVNGHVNWSYKHLSIGATYRYLSKTENIDLIFTNPFFIQGVDAFREDQNNGSHIADLILSYQFKGDITLRLNVKNINNEFYAVRPAMIEPPRSYSIQLTKKW
ncbi:MAG TPA: TonB-dependent receptor [Saprospiraceae bacterium]|nr:TonB-dependent receptor [Saprospiraceae bacterium]